MWPRRNYIILIILLLALLITILMILSRGDQGSNAQNNTTSKEKVTSEPDTKVKNQALDILTDQKKDPSPSPMVPGKISMNERSKARLKEKSETPIIYLYDSMIDSMGAIDFSAFQKACDTHKPPGTTLVKPFISGSQNDIKALAGNFVKSPVKSYPKNHQISATWNELWDGNIEISLTGAAILSGKKAADKEWWSGSDAKGNKDIVNDCSNWKSSLNYQRAPVGSSKSKNASWIIDSLKGCRAMRSLLCISL